MLFIALLLCLAAIPALADPPNVVIAPEVLAVQQAQLELMQTQRAETRQNRDKLPAIQTQSRARQRGR